METEVYAIFVKYLREAASKFHFVCGQQGRLTRLTNISCAVGID